MTKTFEIYKLIEASRSLDKLIQQDLNYNIQVSYNLIKTKREIETAIDYVMERFAMLCGQDVDFDNLDEGQKNMLNALLSQSVDIEIPNIAIDQLINTENVNATPSDVDNIMYIFEKRD